MTSPRDILGRLYDAAVIRERNARLIGSSVEADHATLLHDAASALRASVAEADTLRTMAEQLAVEHAEIVCGPDAACPCTACPDCPVARFRATYPRETR